MVLHQGFSLRDCFLLIVSVMLLRYVQVVSVYLCFVNHDDILNDTPQFTGILRMQYSCTI
jgi:hypothetical protein